MDNLYEKIESLCSEKGINITQMCREAGVPRGNLTDLKKGRQQGLSAKNLNKISVYFKVPISYFLGNTIDPQKMFVDISRLVLEGNDKKESPSDLDELEDYIQMLRDRPECRALLKTASGATRTEVEENVRFIEALRTAKKTD